MTTADKLTTDYADMMAADIRDTMARVNGESSTCVHCGRVVVDVDGVWSDLDATGDDGVWRETCDAHDTFAAEHEPDDDTDHDADDYRDAAREELDERPLELVARIGSPYEILLTFGGPNVRIVWDGRYGTDSAELTVHWGGDVAVRSSGPIREMAAYFGEIMEGDEA